MSASLCAAPASSQDDPAKAAFNRAPCEVCHGPEANGSGPGPALVPLTYNFAELTGIVRQGVGHMPPIPRSDLSDANLEQVFSYLKRLSGAAVATPTTGSPSGGAGDVADIRSRLDRARRANDLEGLATIAEQARRTAADIDLAAAYATWEQVSQSAAPAADSAARISDTIGRVEGVLRSREMVTSRDTKDAQDTREQADTHAFVAALCALELSLKGAADPALGAKIDGELHRARALDPDGPRVLFLAGVAATLAPDAAGGLDAAERQLRRAQQLLSKPAPAGVWPAWGAADASAWLGRVLFMRGDLVGARRAYVRALELEPNYLWITRVLLPALAR